MSGKFITVEGLEGAGKTTQAEIIANWLRERHVDVVRTREPGGTLVAEAIRDVILSPVEEVMDSDTELLLVFAARKQHLSSLIKPAMAADKVVVCDRFTDATYAYQGGGRGIEEASISLLEQKFLQDFQPDLTFWFDCSAEVGMERAKARGQLDRIEQESVEFFNRCRTAYQKRSNQFPDRFIVINADQPIETVTDQVIEHLENTFE